VIGDARDLVHAVGDVEHRDADLVAQPLQERQDLGLARIVERRERFVQQQEARVREQGAADRDTLLLASRQRARAALEQLAEAEQRHNVIEARCGGVLLAALAAVVDIRPHVHVREQARFLEHEADAAALGGDIDPAF